MTAATQRVQADDPFSADEIFRRVQERISSTLPAGALDRASLPISGDHALNANWVVSPDFLGKTLVAAVLIGLVVRDHGVSVILTQRTGDLRAHAGQISLPGGKMDERDRTPAETALREANEEVGLTSKVVDILGYLDAYLTGSGYWIIPVVARVTPPFELVLNPAEVVEAFEVPFAHLMEAANYETRHRVWQGRERAFYAITHGERTIWGITAGILRAFYERLYL